jgi:hypothetical protein
MGHTTLKITSHYYSQTVEQSQHTQEMYSPLRIRKTEVKQAVMGAGIGMKKLGV